MTVKEYMEQKRKQKAKDIVTPGTTVTQTKQAAELEQRKAFYRAFINKDRAHKFRKALEPYVSASRKIRGSGRSKRSGNGSSKSDLAAIREWARGQGLDVSERGRISRDIREAYKAAH